MLRELFLYGPSLPNTCSEDLLGRVFGGPNISNPVFGSLGDVKKKQIWHYLQREFYSVHQHLQAGELVSLISIITKHPDTWKFYPVPHTWRTLK